ncbi:helix-turn-helix domain-containing protein [Paenalcaligenes sp. Me131]|uniref:helix-turn-helix domain-containing protein n=1 Tax=Paenalcaligenes sp. Me131 TaxID=3392636 RepID=UPI003D2655C4
MSQNPLGTSINTDMESEFTEFPDRINLAIDRAGGAKKLAEKMGMSTSVLRSWRSGNSDPSRSSLLKMAKASDLSISWLASGEGSPYHDTPPPQQVSACIDLDSLEDVITKTRQLFLKQKINLRPEAEARIIRLVYEFYLRQGHQLDEASLNNIIELASFR